CQALRSSREDAWQASQTFDPRRGIVAHRAGVHPLGWGVVPQRSHQFVTVPVSLLGLATAVPRVVLEQDDIAARAREIFGPLFKRLPQLDDVFVNAGIATRYSVQPVEWF